MIVEMSKPDNAMNEFPFVVQPTGTAIGPEVREVITMLEKEFDYVAEEDEDGNYRLWRKRPERR